MNPSQYSQKKEFHRILKKSKLLQEAKKPENASEVRSSLSMAQYSARFNPSFSRITEPLRNLTKKDTPWNWGENEDKAFRDIQNALTEEATTSYFDPNPVNMQVSLRYRHLPDLYRTYRIPFAHTGLVPFPHTSTGTIPANTFVDQYCFTIGIVVPAIYWQISSGPVSSYWYP